MVRSAYNHWRTRGVELTVAHEDKTDELHEPDEEEMYWDIVRNHDDYPPHADSKIGVGVIITAQPPHNFLRDVPDIRRSIVTSETPEVSEPPTYELHWKDWALVALLSALVAGFVALVVGRAVSR